MVMNDLVHSREAEPGSRKAGREERLEQSSRHAFVEPVSAVDDSQAHVAARRKPAMAHLDGSGHVLLLRGHADGSVALHRLRRVGAQIEDDLLQLRRLAGHGDIDRNVVDDELDAGRQRSVQQRGGLLEQGAHLHRPGTPVAPPPEREDVVDQIAPTLRGPSYLVDMLRRLGSGRELRLDHLRIAENGADDVVEVMRNSACQRPDHLHAARPFQPRRESRPVALEKLALDGIGHGVAGKPHHRQRQDPLADRVEGVETHDALHPARPDQRHAGPGAHAGGRERVLHCAGRQGGDVRHGGNIGSSRAELRRQRQRLIGPARRKRPSVPGPGVHSGGDLIQHHIGAFRADRPAELAQHLLQPRVGFRRRAIDEACRILGYDVLERCQPSYGKGAGTQPQAEIREHDEQQYRR